ncbi:amidohydrolase [Apiosordaria backusii]|uniref:Amidohydrolase n=1 Tax=Apiosordaria backusii TaxID=314023 RepID=A0AA40F0E6_9PEZI|nr:amidohydrolase [Apiosordaria backusii]
MTTPNNPPVVVDIHTHMYPPFYIHLLQSRTTIPSSVPLLSSPPSPDHLPGRPLTKSYTSLPAKISFMNTHNITTSVLSLANPWLDFLPPSTAGQTSLQINADFQSMCSSSQANNRLYFFACLPLSAPLPTILDTITYLTTLPHCRGVIMGTSGLGSGLDDTNLLPVLKQLAEDNLPIFLHPHYGLPNEVFGERATKGEYGHVLPLALGFPMETTIAVTRMFLAGVFDAVPELKMILAHSGGTLPFLAGRIESCLRHDGYLFKKDREEGKGRRGIWEVLKSQIYLDAVVYSEVGLKAAIEASGEGGVERLMFGTDHPFFPPLEEGEEQWGSVTVNKEAVDKALGEGSKEAELVMGGNAVRVLRLYEE